MHKPAKNPVQILQRVSSQTLHDKFLTQPFEHELQFVGFPPLIHWLIPHSQRQLALAPLPHIWSEYWVLKFETATFHRVKW
ncbi:unnamed protein product [Blepharisma stoltei]|uniref:Uncharacterized protein n=1 Tax=Blepharisma stoltei TaxID=1481888 RepID=A0AAU9IGM3_9CILI|nr:unnamed protein product [Blepharisma stoltei]